QSSSSIPRQKVFYSFLYISFHMFFLYSPHPNLQPTNFIYVVIFLFILFLINSPKVVKIAKSNWVDHRTFGLSMQVFGSVSHHVINIMGAAIMESQFTKHLRGF